MASDKSYLKDAYTVLHRGNFPLPDREGVACPLQYLFIEEKGQKSLVIRLDNSKDEMLTGLKLEVSIYNDKGNRVKVLLYDYPDLCEGSLSRFVLNRKIALGKYCHDFSIKILSVYYGDYVYNLNDGKYELSYEKQTDATIRRRLSTVKKNTRVKDSISLKKFKISSFACVVAFMVLGLCGFLTYFQLNNFMDGRETFAYNGVKYAFATDDVSETAPIVAVGVQKNTKNVVIEDTILGHDVVGIEGDGFRYNYDIQSLTIRGSLQIPELTFQNCKNLTSLKIDRVTSIGEGAFMGCDNLLEVNAFNLSEISNQAFANCSALSKVNISNPNSVLTLASRAFSNCTSLTDVTINQYIDYSDGLDFLFGSYNVTNLAIKNFNYAYEFDGGFSDETVSEMFGVGYRSFSAIRLENLTIEHADNIPNYFAYGLKLRSMTFANLKSTEVGDYAFNQCDRLAVFSAPNYFTKVGDYGFYGTSISEFDGRALTHIGAFAFSRCAQLVNFRLENNVDLVSIGDNAFSNSVRLSKIYIPEKITSLSNGLFSGCSALTEVMPRGKIVAIGNATFSKCTSLSAIDLKNVESMGMFAFEDCTKLVEIELSTKLATIPNSAFSGCVALRKISLARVSAISSSAFAGCISLASVVIPSSVTRIERGAFSECESLVEIDIPFVGGGSAGGEFFAFIFGADYFDQSSVVPKSLAKVTISGSNRIYSYGFFDCKYIEEVVIAGNVNRIGSYAFAQSKNLRSITLPSSMSVIEDRAFEGCVKLYEVYNLSQLNVIRGSSQLGMLAYYALAIYSSLSQPRMIRLNLGAYELSRSDSGDWYMTAFSIDSAAAFAPPASFEYDGKTINSYMIVRDLASGNQNVTSINVPKSVYEIGDYAFAECENVTSVSIAEGVSIIGFGAFSGNISLTTLTLPFVGRSADDNLYLGYIFGSYNALDWGKVPPMLENVTVTNAKTIGDYAFYQLFSIKQLNLAGYISSIGDYAFSGTMIESFEVPSSVESIGFGAFSECELLSSIKIPFVGGSRTDNTYFGYIFGCVSWQEAALPSNLTRVELSGATDVPEYGFYGLWSISEYVLPHTLKSIGTFAFAYNTFANIQLPVNLETIGEYAFYNCYNLTQVTLPYFLNSVGVGAFGECNSMSEVTIYGSPSIGNDAFINNRRLYEVYNLGSLNIQSGSSSYGAVAQNAIVVYTSQDQEKLVTHVEDSIIYKIYDKKAYLMGYERDINYLKIQAFSYDDVQINTISILDRAFEGAYALESVYIDEAVVSMGAYAFAGCSNLKTVDMLASRITRIGDYAFAGCTMLSSVTLPSPLLSIGREAFYCCEMLYTVTLPKTLTQIDDGAFIACFALSEIVNLSSLSIDKGEATNGFVGYYAFSIVDKVEDSSVSVLVDGCTFMLIGQEWILVAISSATTALPSSFKHQDSQIESFALSEYAFGSRYLDSLYIPLSVTRIISQGDNWFSVGLIQYEGSKDEWKLLMDTAPNCRLKYEPIEFLGDRADRFDAKLSIAVPKIELIAMPRIEPIAVPKIEPIAVPRIETTDVSRIEPIAVSGIEFLVDKEVEGK